MAEVDEDAPCKRCGQAFTIECGYERSAHGFCWPCCDVIVEKLFKLASNRLAIRRMGSFTEGKLGLSTPLSTEALHCVVNRFLEHGTDDDE